MPLAPLRLDFRLPISPTPSFCNRIRFFCAALRRLGGSYAEAQVHVTVGDHADLDRLRGKNRWAEDFPLTWHRVPDELFDTEGYFGTSDYRYLLAESSADLIILADADTALVKPLGNAFDWMMCEQPAMAGHMAHAPPPVKFPTLSAEDLWPFLFREFAIPWPKEIYRYSIDPKGVFPPAPAYYNLGFIVLNRAALSIFKSRIFQIRDQLNAILTSEMRCQIGATLVSYLYGIRRQNLPAAFNAANDERHLGHNQLPLDEIRVIHYLRRGEIDRESFHGSGFWRSLLHANLRNPVNQLLQKLAREIIDDAWESKSSNELGARQQP